MSLKLWAVAVLENGRVLYVSALLDRDRAEAMQRELGEGELVNIAESRLLKRAMTENGGTQ